MRRRRRRSEIFRGAADFYFLEMSYLLVPISPPILEMSYLPSRTRFLSPHTVLYTCQPPHMRALHMRDMHVRVLHTCETRTLTSHTFPTQFRLPLARRRPPLPYTCEPRRPISHTFAIAGLDSCQYTSSPITCFNVFHHAQAHLSLVVCLHVPPPAACSLLCEPYLCAPMAHAV